jgi:thiamine biosynthesis lipoprotein
MGTVCRIAAFGPPSPATAAALEAALDAIADAESLLSTWLQDTELARLNARAHRGPVAVSGELGAFLERVLAVADSTAGAFDPTVGGLVDVWDQRGAGRIPSETELRQAQESVGFRHVRVDSGAGTVAYAVPGLWLDSGASGKGYALERAADVLRRRGVRSALLDFGGQLLAVGAPPGDDAWTVAVADPEDRRGPALILRLRDVSVATSSQWERGRQVEGRWIGHILDPRSGRPVDWQGSTTVVAPDALQADALATGLFVLGPETGQQWARGRTDLGVAFLSRDGDGVLLVLQGNAAFRGWLSEQRNDVSVRLPRAGRKP